VWLCVRVYVIVFHVCLASFVHLHHSHTHPKAFAVLWENPQNQRTKGEGERGRSLTPVLQVRSKFPTECVISCNRVCTRVSSCLWRGRGFEGMSGGSISFRLHSIGKSQQSLFVELMMIDYFNPPKINSSGLLGQPWQPGHASSFVHIRFILLGDLCLQKDPLCVSGKK
jgi:hypothetical protein